MKHKTLNSLALFLAFCQIVLFYGRAEIFSQRKLKPSFPPLQTPSFAGVESEPGSQTDESLYIKISVMGELNDFEIHDDRGRSFRPYFFRNLKNAAEIQRLESGKFTEEDKRKYANILTQLPGTNFNANASQAWGAHRNKQNLPHLFSGKRNYER